MDGRGCEEGVDEREDILEEDSGRSCNSGKCMIQAAARVSKEHGNKDDEPYEHDIYIYIYSARDKISMRTKELVGLCRSCLGD